MPYETAKTSVVLNPEYFRQEALKFNANPTDRKQWLQKQQINLQASLNRYASATLDLMERGAKLDGVNTAAQWMTAIGGIAVTIPTGYTQIGGAVLAIAGMIVSAAEKRKDSKALRELQSEARQLQLEVTQIKTYYDNYSGELSRMNLLPIALFGAAALLISKQ